MLNNILKTMTLLACLFAPAAYAHTGIHNGMYHPLSGVDHFLVVLIIGIISAIVLVTIKMNRK